ncbi:TROVE domain-containing protein [Spirillospora sp. NPDC052242]
MHQPAADGSRARSPARRARQVRQARKEATIDGPFEELFVTTLARVGYEDVISAWPRGDAERFTGLVREAARADPAWTAAFLGWLRTATPMRYPALVGAAAFVRERPPHGPASTPRRVVASVLRHPHDPGLMLGHWLRAHRKPLPKPLKRGVADAVTRLYDERALALHDTGGRHLSIPPFLRPTLTVRGGLRAARPPRFGEVISLVHPRPRDAEQAEVFRLALRRRVPAAPARSWRQKAGAQGRRLRRDDWERLIPRMPLPDLLDGLRRFDAAGISFDTAMEIAERLADPAEVRASGLLPLRFAAARDGVADQRWGPILEDAAGVNLPVLPLIPGRTLVVAGNVTAAGAVFALALALRCASADVVTGEGEPLPVVPGESPLHGRLRWPAAGLGDARRSDPAAVARALGGHDRVVAVEFHGTDELGAGVPVYAWTAEHWPDHVRPPAPGRVDLHGLSDAALGVVPLIEDARRGRWPF